MWRRFRTAADRPVDIASLAAFRIIFGAVNPATVAARVTKDPVKAREMIKNGAIVIDVRTTDEYSADHLSMSTNIPLQDFESRIADVEKLTGGDKAKPVVLHCAAGGRAAKAKKSSMHSAIQTSSMAAASTI
jgi:rhodanese-related sulfurtransferase